MRTIILTGLMWSLLAGASSAEQPVAMVGRQPISQATLDKHVKVRLLDIDNQRYQVLRDGLDELIVMELYAQEAKARGVTVEALQQEVSAKAAAPTDAEIQQMYDSNKQALKGASLESVKPRIVDYLTQQKRTQAEHQFLDGLRKKYAPVVMLEAPRDEVGTGGRPERGPKNAPVTIIEFSDYECPACKQAEDAVQQVLRVYGDKVRFVYRDFPMEAHANALPAAEAAHCAQAQGKFWEYHGKLIVATDLSADNLKALADEVKLDRAKFDDCVAKQPFKAEIEKGIAEAADAGVSGTPAFFINGRFLSGAEPFETFKEIIDEELARGTPKKAS